MSAPVDDQVAEQPTPSEDRMVGTRFAAVVAVVVLVALLAVLFALNRVGTSSRKTPAAAAVVVVDDSRQLLDAWTSAGLRGVVLLDATRDTSFVWIPPDSVPAPAVWPVAPVDLQGVYQAGVGRGNVIWVGSKIGMLRSVHYLMTPADYDEKVSGGRAVGARGIAPDGQSVTANDEGYLRYLRASLPPDLGEPAVLNVDASYFIDGTPEGLVAQLGDSLTDYRFVTVNRAIDATDVPAAARLEADRMAEILRAQVSR